MGAFQQEALQQEAVSPKSGSQLVVRNTFLEFTEDSDLHDGDQDSAPRRGRALTDLTDSRSPLKEEYPVNCFQGDGGGSTPSTVGDAEFESLAGRGRLAKIESGSCLVQMVGASSDSEGKLDSPGRRWCDEMPTSEEEVGGLWGIGGGGAEATQQTAAKAVASFNRDAAAFRPEAAAAAFRPEAWPTATDVQYAVMQQELAAWWGCHSGPGFPMAPGLPPTLPPLPTLSTVPPPPQGDATRAALGRPIGAPGLLPQQPTVCVKLDAILNLDQADAKEKAPARAGRKKGAKNRGGSQEPVRNPQGGKASGPADPAVEGKPLRAVKTAPGQLDKMCQEKAETPPRSLEKKAKQPKQQAAPQPKPPLQEAPQEQPQSPAAAAAAPPAPAADAAPEAPAAEEVEKAPVPIEQQTTVMLRNIPNKYTQAMLLSLLSDHGFGKSFDFVYLPMDFRNGVNLGYAFVNVATREDATRLMETFQGYDNWIFESPKVCEVSWAHPHQGLHEHVERYRNSPVMHGCMPDEYKPMLFRAGERVPFPEPTRPIRAPKLRPAREKIAQAEVDITGESIPAMAQGA
mmetsp:Transcript_12459/g.35005  ORF Transcript_12459/g.35005 Transcript_12459/m.35005 type:complete len:571 (-) Transcript_12459:276-1988(-)